MANPPGTQHPPRQHVPTRASNFNKLANWASTAAGRPAAFGTALALILLWALLGPVFNFSNTWQLVVNTATTIITFLMVFLIQHTQNRDTIEMHIKLDELIRVSARARNVFIALEELGDEELDRLRKELREMAHRKPVGIPTPQGEAPRVRRHSEPLIPDDQGE
jgi:low affinity Fe/Cu permease